MFRGRGVECIAVSYERKCKFSDCNKIIGIINECLTAITMKYFANIFGNFWFLYLILLIRKSNAIHARIQKYFWTLDDCGIGRESQLMDSTCFDYHKTAGQLDMIKDGRPARVGEFPWILNLENDL